ncbi:MAG: segregation/condensation protein A [Gammaproteobacteria bacterium]|nr:segregation/condensation protein A [Gammaproteobacteria bacterium]MYE82287.1 segregation/condensation protein A [Gammaproteobacteria bacterium]
MSDDEGRVTRLDAERRKRRGGSVVAIVGERVVDELPTDLYIPPDALEVILETFEGPLDLLLYLIRRQNLDILEVQVAEITDQYMRYIELMSALRLTLAGEYLAMAATLAEIKSRLLLPRPVDDEDEEGDPRAELIRRLQEYERIRDAAERLADLPRLERDVFPAGAEPPELVTAHPPPAVELKELMLAMADVLHRANLNRHHAVQFEALSVRERMTSMLARVNAASRFLPLEEFFSPQEGKHGIIVSFLAVLELHREGLIDLVQHRAFAPIYLRAAS